MIGRGRTSETRKQKALVSDMFEETDDIDGLHLVRGQVLQVMGVVSSTVSLLAM